MGKRRRDSDSSELSDVPSHVSDAAQEPANANENAQDAMDAAPAEPPAPPAAPAEPPPKPSGGLQLKIKLTVNPGGAAAVEAASPAVPPPSDAPGTAELVKTRRRNRPSDFGVSATPEELAAALGMPSARPKGSDKRPAKRLKSDPELAALTPVKAEKGAADKGKTPGTGKADSKKGSPEARAVFLGLIEDLRAQTAADGRPMIYLFEKLPTKKELPDYYILIERPIDLVGIENKVKKDAYPSMKEFKADVDLMFNNAKKYNMPGSDIYKDATALHKHFTSAAGKAKIPAAGTAPPALKITLKSSLIAGEAAVAGEKKEERDPSLRKKLTEGEIKQYFLAIHSDNEEEVKKFLAPPYNVNITRLFTANLDGATFKWTALQAAAFYGAVKVIRVLMAAGSNVEQQDEWYGGRALAWACFGNRAEAAKVLIEEFGADKTAANNGGQLPWDLVADKLDGKWKGVILSEEDWTAQRNEIIRKAEAGDMAALAAHLPLMTHNTKSKTLYAEEYVKLTRILKEDDLDGIIQFGIVNRFDVNHMFTTRELGDTFKWGPLHGAAYFGAIKCAKHLIAKGAQIDTQDQGYFSTPLHWAVYGDRPEMAKMLLEEYKADPFARNGAERTPVQMAENPDDPKWKEIFDKYKLTVKIHEGKGKKDDEEEEDLDSGSIPTGPYPAPPIAKPKIVAKIGTSTPMPRAGQAPYYGTPTGAVPMQPGFRPGAPFYPGGPGFATPGMPPGFAPQRPFPGVPGFGSPMARPPIAQGLAPPKLTLYVPRADKAIISAIDIRAANSAWTARIPTIESSVSFSAVTLPVNSAAFYITVFTATPDLPPSTLDRKLTFQLNAMAIENVQQITRSKEGSWTVEVTMDMLRDGANMLECLATEKQEQMDGFTKVVTHFKNDSYMILANVTKMTTAA